MLESGSWGHSVLRTPALFFFPVSLNNNDYKINKNNSEINFRVTGI